MKDNKVVFGVILVVVLGVLAVMFINNKTQRYGEDKNTLPTPTVTSKTVNPTPTTSPSMAVIPTPFSATKVLSYTSKNGYVSLSFTQAMNVYEYMETATDGWIVVSMNVIDKGKPQANGLIINFQSPSVEGKGGACESGYKSNSMLGQTIQYCETQKELSGGYLKNINAEMEYAFYITAKGLSEKDAYKDVLFNGLSLE
jgi:hypothetical protein